jgi:hypothetical protein
MGDGTMKQAHRVTRIGPYLIVPFIAVASLAAYNIVASLIATAVFASWGMYEWYRWKKDQK